jgi:hypothetical protein
MYVVPALDSHAEHSFLESKGLASGSAFLVCHGCACTLSRISPSPRSLELEKWGYTVYEAVEFSEILYLCDYIKPSAVVVSHGVEVHGLSEIAQRHIVIEQQGLHHGADHRNPHADVRA